MHKEWQYMINKDEIYFTSEFRFPLKHIKQITLDRGKSGTLWIVAGLLALLVPIAGWGVMAPTQQVLIVILGLGSLLWGLKLNFTYQVGFVILKDPKWYEKVYVKVLQTHSYEKAEEMLEALREELSQKGLERVRVVKTD